MMNINALKKAVLGVIAVLALGSCSSDSETITVDGAWARTSPMNTELGAVYMNITAAEDDALVSATVDSSVAMSASVHETTMNADGTMAMQEVEKVALPAGTAVSFEPGGYHIMLMGLNQPLSLGDTVTVTLTFESGESVSVDAEVRDQAP
jgi:copper(I)-binding protein